MGQEHAQVQGDAGIERGWLRVMVLWIVSVACFAAFLYLLAALQLQQLQAADLALLSRALREGNSEQVSALASSPSYQLMFPTSLLVQFAAVGLVVVACAWLGRRVLAAAVPLVVALASLAPAYWGAGSQAPHPIGEDDSGLWGGLARVGGTWSSTGSPTGSPTGSATGWSDYGAWPTWPLWFGIAVQTMLLLLPLVAAPRSRPSPLPSKDALLRATVPAAVLGVGTLALVPAGSPAELIQASLVAGGLAYVVTFLMVGDRPPLARGTSAVVIPAVMAPVLLETRLDTPGQGVLLAMVVGAMALIVLMLSVVTRRLQTNVGRTAAVASPLS